MDDAPRCGTCGFGVEHPVARLDAATLGVFSDARLVGRCVLVLDTHEEHFERLAPELAQRFMADATRAARAIRVATGAPRINYALLANQVNHLHLHLFPRGGSDDPDPRVSPWELELPEPPLASSRIATLRAQLARALESDA
jgi:diadenosine tetraphosphate (Ap4A) HIT family hydrolase